MKHRRFLMTLMAVITATVMVGQDMTRGETRAKIATSIGDIVVRLYDATPIHRDNFVRLAKEGFYNGTLFHRVIKGFMIQGGDPNTKVPSTDKQIADDTPDYTLEAEIRNGLYHKRGALAAAREGDDANPERRSSGSQFYIVWGRTFSPRQMEFLVDKMQQEHPETGGLTSEQQQVYSTLGGSPHLDGQYTVFGEVESGLDVVEKIQNVTTDAADRPVENISMTITIL